jgi:hypothetical protein
MRFLKLKNYLNSILVFFKRIPKGGNMAKSSKDESKDYTQPKETSKDKWEPRLKNKFSSRFDWKKLLK